MLRILHSENITASSINSSENYNGIHIYNSYNISISDLEAYYNSESGVYIFTLDNSTISDFSVNNNTNGIYLYNGINNTFVNGTAKRNGWDGIRLAESSYGLGNGSIVTNVTMRDNLRYGLYITTSENTINDSIIENNTQYGLYMTGATMAFNNHIYNNYFNNTINYYNGTAGLTNYFNTTNQTGPNIVNGSYIGGNYWENASTSTYDFTCTDSDSDGYCDLEYSLDGDNNDSLPLMYNIQEACVESWSCTAWSTCSSSIQTRTCTDQNACGTTTNKPPESQSCTSGGGTTGGGIIKDQPTQTVYVEEITPEEPVDFEITNDEIEITKITVDTTETVQNVEITVTKIDVLPLADIEIGLVSGETYSAFQVETTGINDSNTESIIIEFKVEKSWLITEKGTIDGIVLFRKEDPGNDWDELPTTYLRSDDQYYYFTADTLGFSMFAIILDLSGCNKNQICETDIGENEINCPSDCRIIQPTVVCTPDATRCYANQIQRCAENGTAWEVLENCPKGCEDNKCIVPVFDEQLLILISAIFAVMLIVMFFLKVKTKPEGKGVSRRFREPSGTSV